ncbi:multidrug effflux MFS transporter [Nocardia flavorosea]|uniref:Multidrug effflux MFS transporter n=1 Tax=Nocardia flavorosea TaxID=53429 RepID=A0A846YHD2_9NOCA|nr:multidrug effflux MFS transporter [Nocardia flavorosea]NKY58417.1 multidrug effflux MFS transporter [Nocardia flavorosea]
MIAGGIREPTDARTPIEHNRFRLVLTLGALTALGPFTVDMYLPALPVIAADLGTSDATIQLTLTATLIGVAVGQLVIGPLSDAYGRRRPLIAGSAIHVAASVACYFAPSVAVLAGLRTLQGVGAAATAVIAMAVVRDLFTGREAAVVLSRLMLVMGVAPVLAPSIGGLLIPMVSWHGVFLALAGLGVVMVVLGCWALPETLPRAARARHGTISLFRSYGVLVRDRVFVLLVLVCGLVRAVLWAYIAGSAFVLQHQFELSPQLYGFAFAVGAVALIGASQLNVLLLGHWSPDRICLVSLLVSVITGAVFVVVSATDTGGLTGFAVPLMVLLGATGLAMPNSVASALSRHGAAAGSAAAVVGFTQFGAAAIAAPAVGLLGNSALAIAIAMTGAAALALLGFLAARRHSRRQNDRVTPGGR